LFTIIGFAIKKSLMGQFIGRLPYIYV